MVGFRVHFGLWIRCSVEWWFKDFSSTWFSSVAPTESTVSPSFGAYDIWPFVVLVCSRSMQPSIYGFRFCKGSLSTMKFSKMLAPHDLSPDRSESKFFSPCSSQKPVFVCCLYPDSTSGNWTYAISSLSMVTCSASLSVKVAYLCLMWDETCETSQLSTLLARRLFSASRHRVNSVNTLL